VVGVLAGVEMGNARSEKKARKEAATATPRDRLIPTATPKVTQITPRVRPQVKNPVSVDRAEVEVVLEGKAHALILATNNRSGQRRAVLTHRRRLLPPSRAKPAPKVDRDVRSLFCTRNGIFTPVKQGDGFYVRGMWKHIRQP
jgi:hypothetical protein